MTFLRDLSPRRTSLLFLAALIAGILLILPNWGAVWAWVLMPVIPVVLYSAALYASQVRFLVSHTSAVKSSPYILGFTLTLLALFNLFLSGGAALLDGTIDQDLLLGQIGAAIATTAFGLLARQVLITHDAQEEVQHQVFSSLASELRRNAKDFDSAQRQLVSLIKEFVATREELFSREEQALERFLGGLESGSQILTKIQTTYPKRLRAALETFGTDVAALDKAVNHTTRTLAELCTTVKSGNQEVQESTSALLNQLSESSRKWGDASQAAMGALEASRSALRAREDGIGHTFDDIRGSLVKSQENHNELVTLFDRLLADVRAMDHVVDEVASLLSRRVAESKNE